MNQDMLSRLQARLEQPEEEEEIREKLEEEGQSGPQVESDTPQTVLSSADQPSLIIQNDQAVSSLPQATPPHPTPKGMTPEPLEARTPGVGEEDSMTPREAKHKRRKRKGPKVEAVGAEAPPPAPPEVEASMEVSSEDPLPSPHVVVDPPSRELLTPPPRPMMTTPPPAG